MRIKKKIKTCIYKLILKELKVKLLQVLLERALLFTANEWII